MSTSWLEKRNSDAEKLTESILNTSQHESVDDTQDALYDLFVPLFENVIQGELKNHLGYDDHSKEPLKYNNRQYDYGNNALKTSIRNSY